MAKNVTNVNISGPTVSELMVIAIVSTNTQLSIVGSTRLCDIKTNETSIFQFMMDLEDRYNIRIDDSWITSETATFDDLVVEVTRLIKQPW